MAVRSSLQSPVSQILEALPARPVSDIPRTRFPAVPGVWWTAGHHRTPIVWERIQGSVHGIILFIVKWHGRRIRQSFYGTRISVGRRDNRLPADD